MLASVQRFGLILIVSLASNELNAQIWSEEFNAGSAPNNAVWSYEYGDGCPGLCGWGNNELQSYTSDPANVRVEGGHLVITALRDGNNFTSARIKTQDKITFIYGTVEARIQVPDLGNGLWPAFWTLGNNWPAVGWPACGEIDVLEMGSGGAIDEGKVNRRVGSTAHWEHNGGYAGYGLTRDHSTDLNGTFHVYRMEWTPTEITTYIDGDWIWTIDITSGSCTDCTEFHEPHFFLFNMAVGGNYTGITSPGAISAAFPAEYRIDWLRIYDNGHTVMGGSGYVPVVTPVTLTALPVGGGIQITFPTQNGAVYGVEYKNAFTGGDWTLLEAVLGDGNPAILSYAVTNTSRIYRVTVP